MSTTFTSRPHPDAGYEPWARAALDRGQGLTPEMGRAVMDELDRLRDVETAARAYLDSYRGTTVGGVDKARRVLADKLGR